MATTRWDTAEACVGAQICKGIARGVGCDGDTELPASESIRGSSSLFKKSKSHRPLEPWSKEAGLDGGNQTTWCREIASHVST